MARQTTAAMDAALSGERCCVTGFLEVNIPGYDLCLYFGAGEIAWNGKTFRGRDDTYGVLAALDPPEDGFGDTAPGMGFEIHPESDVEAADLASELTGSRVRFWLVALDDAGAPIPDPLDLFDGEVDQPFIEVDGKSRTLEIECVSDMEKLFENEEGRRLSDASHQEIWPAELGLVHMTGIVKRRMWGPGEAISGSGGGVVGGGGGGGDYGGGGGRFQLDSPIREL